MTLTASAAHYSPMTMVNSSGLYTGISMEIWHSMQREMNFSYEVVTTPDGNWGSREADGSWNGFVGQLIKYYWDILNV